MKEKIERFSKGDFEYELPFLCLSEEEILITVEAGKTFEGGFTICNSSKRSMKGILYSSNRLLTFGHGTFEGTDNTVTYQFNAVFLNPGEDIQGEISIVSDCGERILPFQVRIEAPCCETSLGKVKDLFQFTNLARMDWTEAKRVFRSDEFERVLLYNDVKYRTIYRNLLKSISTSQALEEFLIAIHKKSVIHLSIDKTKSEYLTFGEEIRDKLTLTKDSWGYAEIRVSSDAPFIQLEQKFLWADRFIGNTNQISFLLDPDGMRAGKNFGRIYIKTVYQTITLDVECNYRKEADTKRVDLIQLERFPIFFMDNYLNFRLNKISLSEYLEDTGKLLKQNKELIDPSLIDLINTHLAIISGKDSIAAELLEEFAGEETIRKKKSVLQYCAYLYLKALFHKDEETIKNVAQTIRSIYENGNDDWRILWFLLYTDKRYEKNKSDKLAAIKEKYEEGCHSPILYYEAVCIYNEEPYLLRNLFDFEIQVLNFGIKNWILSKDVALQYAYLANKRKTFHPVIFRGLEKLYDEFGIQEILFSICCMLIKGLKRSAKYFEWFRLGVEAQLKITELYEYYMYSVSESHEEPLAQPVLLYFIYNSSLNDRKKAFLYANIIKHKDTFEAIYRSYYRKMEVFAAKMLEAQYINRDLAVLYQEFIDRNNPGIEPAKLLPYVMYRKEFICDNPNIVGVTVIHPIIDEEENYTLVEGRAQINVYSENKEIILLDTNGNRYSSSVEYQLKVLLNPEDYENVCLEYSSHPMLLLHMFEKFQQYRVLSDKSIMVRNRVLELEGLKEEYYIDCLQTLIDHYYENYQPKLLEHYLYQLDLHKVHPANRVKFMEYLLLRAPYGKSMEALEIFGFDGIPINRLVTLCSGWLMETGSDTKSAFVISLCYYVFTKGKYDEAILRYLVKYYYGPTRDMYLLWKSAKEFEIESHRLEERLLMQMLLGESHVQDSFQIFNEYYKDVTNPLLVKAFLSYYAYRYLVHDRVINEELFPIMRRELNYEENDICLLAWLKFKTTDLKPSENEIKYIEISIHHFVKKDIVLPFFCHYRNVIKLPESMADKTYVEYRTDPRKQVYIHYCLAKYSDGNYITERLPNSFMGIHSKGFLLFSHETLQYYITEELDEEVNVTESYQVEYKLETTKEDSKFNQINLMIMAEEMHDEATLLAMIEHYMTMDYMVSKCFKPIERK